MDGRTLGDIAMIHAVHLLWKATTSVHVFAYDFANGIMSACT